MPESAAKTAAKADAKTTPKPAPAAAKQAPTTPTKGDAKNEVPAQKTGAEAKPMTEEERAREEEIQRKIKESVVIVKNDSNPTAEDVEKILKAAPPDDVCMILCYYDLILWHFELFLSLETIAGLQAKLISNYL